MIFDTDIFICIQRENKKAADLIDETEEKVLIGSIIHGAFAMRPGQRAAEACKTVCFRPRLLNAP
ncbi:MAG: hypothetical protein HW390_2185 [Candidatus Brocadiaceae bacterium]|nr:hypothetical protein [Candidatus Brocadiaceae bacterium]